jgi:putative CocE/NonD family hydrolase
MYAELPSVQEAWIGAWSHTGEQHASPFAEGGTPDPPLSGQWATIIDFLEARLRGRAPLDGERAIHYFVMGAEAWRTTQAWPPDGVKPMVSFLGADRRLGPEPPEVPATERMRLDPRASTGTRNRWHTQLAQPVRYGDRARADERLATWAAPTLSSPLEIIGHPTLGLRLVTDRRDLTLFAYLEAVDPRGRVLLLTEGMSRAVHRVGDGQQPTYRRADARPITPGEPFDLFIRLLPTAVAVPAGWAIRLAIAGADAETFGMPPDPHALDARFVYDPDHPASLTLPVRQ